MTEELVSQDVEEPTTASVRLFDVTASRTVSPSFRRVTLRSTGDGFEEEFDYLGYDQWFRLFFSDDGDPMLPYGGMDGWYSRYLALPEDDRPVVRNYTIRDARRDAGHWLIDVDLVLHTGASGTVEGQAAQWSLSCEPGSQVGVLDQGRIFGLEQFDRPLLIVADESGLPGVEAVLRSLKRASFAYPVTCILEVPDAADRRALDVDSVTWVVREQGQAAGDAALTELRERALDADSCAYIVGETQFMLAAKAVCRSAGMEKKHLDFCAYWRR